MANFQLNRNWQIVLWIFFQYFLFSLFFFFRTLHHISPLGQCEEKEEK